VASGCFAVQIPLSRASPLPLHTSLPFLPESYVRKPPRQHERLLCFLWTLSWVSDLSFLARGTLHAAEHTDSSKVGDSDDFLVISLRRLSSTFPPQQYPSFFPPLGDHVKAQTSVAAYRPFWGPPLALTTPFFSHFAPFGRKGLLNVDGRDSFLCFIRALPAVFFPPPLEFALLLIS